jgi:hypothetical protein
MTKKPRTPFLQAVHEQHGESDYKELERQYRYMVKTLHQPHPATFEDWLRPKRPELSARFPHEPQPALQPDSGRDIR